jgi:hypothetical protein
MTREHIVTFIADVAEQPNAFELLEAKVSQLNRDELSATIIDCGVLPEMYAYDSSEEKIWAKYSDIVLSMFFSSMGLESEVLGARGNSADVLAKTNHYTIVGDAKTFRLSRGMFGIRVIISHKNLANDFGTGKTTVCTLAEVCVRS